MGDVVLGELVRERGSVSESETAIDFFLVAVTSEDVPAVLRLGHELRDAGRRVEYALKGQSVAKQLKLASARAASHAVLIGPDERARGEALVRDLATGEESRIMLNELVQSPSGPTDR
jgi:histidyl-tRNA synthetase